MSVVFPKMNYVYRGSFLDYFEPLPDLILSSISLSSCHFRLLFSRSSPPTPNPQPLTPPYHCLVVSFEFFFIVHFPQPQPPAPPSFLRFLLPQPAPVKNKGVRPVRLEGVLNPVGGVVGRDVVRTQRQAPILPHLFCRVSNKRQNTICGKNRPKAESAPLPPQPPCLPEPHSDTTPNFILGILGLDRAPLMAVITNLKLVAAELLSCRGVAGLQLHLGP